jgi:hypothetical protein
MAELSGRGTEPLHHFGLQRKTQHKKNIRT